MGFSRRDIVFGYFAVALSGGLGAVFLVMSLVLASRGPVDGAGFIVVMPGIFFAGAILCWQKCIQRGREPTDPACDVDYHLRPMVESWVKSGGRGIICDPWGYGDPKSGEESARLEAMLEFNRRYHSGELGRLVGAQE